MLHATFLLYLIQFLWHSWTSELWMQLWINYSIITKHGVNSWDGNIVYGIWMLLILHLLYHSQCLCYHCLMLLIFYWLKAPSRWTTTRSAAEKYPLHGSVSSYMGWSCQCSLYARMPMLHFSQCEFSLGIYYKFSCLLA